jgi:SAM-dependent methyltransferase
MTKFKSIIYSSIKTIYIQYKKYFVNYFRKPQVNSIRLHLGCGSNYLKDYYNVDYYSLSLKTDYEFDFLDLFPFEDDTFDFIFCEHVLEHFDYSELDHVVSECKRILKKTGVLRIVVPSLDLVMRDYRALGFSSLHYAIHDLAQKYDHKSLWSSDYANELAEKFSFKIIFENYMSSENFSKLDDSSNRRDGAMYIELIK